MVNEPKFWPSLSRPKSAAVAKKGTPQHAIVTGQTGKVIFGDVAAQDGPDYLISAQAA